MATLAEIEKKAGMKPYDVKAALSLPDSKPIQAKKTPYLPLSSDVDKEVFGYNIDQDTSVASILRGLINTGGRAVSLVNAGAELVGASPIVDPAGVDANLKFMEQKKEEISQQNIAPTRKREIDAIKKEVEKSQGWGSVLPIANQVADVALHPSEWTLQGMVETVADPLNYVGGGAGSLLAKGGSSVMSRMARGAVGGAAENAAVNAVAEGAIAKGRGQSDDEAMKAALGGGVGGVMFGAPIGAISGAAMKPRFASDNILSKVDQHIGTHEVNHASIMDNALMQTPDGETFNPDTDIGFTREAQSITDHPADTLPDIDHHAVYNSVIADMLDSARSENAQVYDQARVMAESGASTEQMKSYIDNAFTPTRDDLNIDDLLNGGEPMPSRLSGMRIIDTLTRNIAIAINDPMGARTNDQIKAALKKEGVSNEYAGVFTKAYAAKDPTILTEYIDAKTSPLRDEIRAVIDERIGTYKTQAEEQKALRWANTVPETAQDLVNHPKFTEHLNERADVSASDARYAQVRTADLALSHENNGQGYETVVQQPAQFDRNYNYDFEMTKKDVADIKAGRWNDELVRRLRNDLDHRDNDPLYNPETPSIRLQREMSDAVGSDQALMNMALIDGRAKAMGITPDELIDKSGLSVENMRDFDGAQYVNDLKDLSFQKDPVNREKRGIYNVQFNGKNSTKIMKDMMDVEQALRFEQGFENPVLNKGYGALHIDKHIGPDKDGWVSKEELLNIGEAVRNVEPYLKDGKRVYEYHNDAGDRFRLIVGDRDSGENVISFYSNRKAGKGNNTLTYVYPSRSENKSLHQKNPDVKLTDDQINGMAELGIAEGDMKSVIYLFKTADASTLPHELMHVFERTLSDVERTAVDDVLKDYAPGTPRKEALARYFEKYLADGEAPTPELKGVFDKFRDWLTSLWENIIHDGSRDFKLTDAHRELYRALLGDREAATKLSERYDGIVQEQIKAEAEVLFQRVSKETSETIGKDFGGDKISEALTKERIKTKTIFRKLYDYIESKTELKGIDTLVKAERVSKAEFIKRVEDSAGLKPKLKDGSWSEPVEIDGVKYNRDADGAIYKMEVRKVYTDSAIKMYFKSRMAQQLGNDFGDIARHRDSTMAMIDDASLELSDILKEMPQEDRNLITLALDEDSLKESGKELPEHLTQTVGQIRKVIDHYADKLVELGILKEEDRKNNYVKRFYMEHVVRVGAMDRIGDYLMGLSPAKKYSEGVSKALSMHHRSDMTLEERQNRGQIFDAAYAIPATLANQRHLIIHAQFFKDISDKFAAVEELPGYTKIPDDKSAYGALAGKYIPHQIASSLLDANALQSGLSKYYINAYSHWKVNKTVKNPFTHLYNITSNVEMMVMTHTSPLPLMNIIKDGKFKEFAELAKRYGLVDHERLSEVLQEKVKELMPVLPNQKDKSAIGTFMDVLSRISGEMYMSKNSYSGKGMRSAYNWEDKIFKLAAFADKIDELSEGKGHGVLSDEQMRTAYSESAETFIDYSKPLPPMWRAIDKVVPFTNYGVRSTPVMLKAMADNPMTALAINLAGGGLVGRYALMGLVGIGFESLAAYLPYFMEDDDEKEKYMKGHKNLELVQDWLKVMSDEEKAVFWNMGRSIGGMKSDFLESLMKAGLLGQTYEFVNGRDFKGRDIRNEDDPIGKQIKDTMASFVDTVTPPVSPFGGHYVQGLYEAVKYGENVRGEKVTVGSVLARAAGVKIIDKENFNARKEDTDKKDADYIDHNAARQLKRAKTENEKFHETKGKKGISDRAYEQRVDRIKNRVSNIEEQTGKKADLNGGSASLPLGGSFIKPINIIPSLNIGGKK